MHAGIQSVYNTFMSTHIIHFRKKDAFDFQILSVRMKCYTVILFARGQHQSAWITHLNIAVFRGFYFFDFIANSLFELE